MWADITRSFTDLGAPAVTPRTRISPSRYYRVLTDAKGTATLANVLSLRHTRTVPDQFDLPASTILAVCLDAFL